MKKLKLLMLVIGITAGLEVSSAFELYNEAELNIENSKYELNQNGIRNGYAPELMDGVALGTPNLDDYYKPKQNSLENNSNKELDFDNSASDDLRDTQAFEINGRTFYEPMDVVNKYPILRMLTNEEQEYYGNIYII